MAGLTLDEIDFEQDAAYVLQRYAAPGLPLRDQDRSSARPVSAGALAPPAAATPWLWLGKRGRLSDSGILQMVRRRGEEAGLGQILIIHLRHSFADAWLASGGNEGDPMRLAGWRPARRSNRYVALAADGRPEMNTAGRRSATSSELFRRRRRP